MENSLKNLAMRAKNRLTTGSPSQSSRNSNVIVHKIKDDDDEFIARVRDLLEEDFDMTNPIGRLLAEEKLDGLSPAAREKHVLNTCERYLKARKLIEQELNSKQAQ